MAMAALCLLWMGLGTGRAAAQDAASNVARVSFVQGSVQLLAGQGTDFQQAVMNMPVLDRIAFADRRETARQRSSSATAAWPG